MGVENRVGIEIVPEEPQPRNSFRKTPKMREVEERLGEPIGSILYRLYWLDDKSLKEVRAEVGLKTHKSVANWMRAAGFSVRTRTEGLKQFLLDPERRKELREKRNIRRKYLQVKAVLGVETDKDFRRVLISLYRQEGSHVRVAERIKELGIPVSATTIGVWMRELEIKMQVGERYRKMKRRAKGVKKVFDNPELLHQIGLTPREDYILRKRYLPESGKQQTLADLGGKFGCDRRAIRGSEKNGLRKIGVYY